MACSNNASGHTASFCGVKADRHMVLRVGGRGREEYRFYVGMIGTLTWHLSFPQHSKDALLIRWRDLRVQSKKYDIKSKLEK